MDSLVYHARGRRVFACAERPATHLQTPPQRTARPRIRGEAKRQNPTTGPTGASSHTRAPSACNAPALCGVFALRRPRSGGGRALAAHGLSPRRTAAPYSTSNK
ncbi:hypothetical protein HMPREF0972_02570 [Actinomyces sp. oral taxon 848 str. F0332]|nr:hypothetical protein HMPREF0972_02570 [Actinomyces sp. oral taxon 848 str. F0332]